MGMTSPRQTIMTTIRLGEDQVLEQITRTIVEHLRPRRIVLFGSRARGTAAPDSDYDIMVEIETELSSTQRVRAVADLFPRREWSMDVLVYTPDEVRRWKDDVGFTLYDIVREGRVLYRRPDVTDGDFWSGDAVSPATRVRERPSERPESLASWIRRAQHDFDASQAIAKLDSPPWDVVCLHAHQAVEKLLKACLVARSVRPPRTHDVREILDHCVRSGFDLEHLGPACVTLYDLWPRSRYPDDGEPTPSEGEAAMAAATTVRSAVLPVLERAR
jgi:HEPN domain-containing protein/predicted nucleotidyltransferase